MLGTTICSTMWPSRSGGIPTPISEPSIVTRNRILLLLLPSTSPSGLINTLINDCEQCRCQYLCQYLARCSAANSHQTLIHQESEMAHSRKPALIHPHTYTVPWRRQAGLFIELPRRVL